MYNTTTYPSINWGLLERRLDLLVDDVLELNKLVTRTQEMIRFVAGEKRTLKKEIANICYNLSGHAATYIKEVDKWIALGQSKENAESSVFVRNARAKLSRVDIEDVELIYECLEQIDARNVEMQGLEKELKYYKTEIKCTQASINDLHTHVDFLHTVFECPPYYTPIGRLVIRVLNIRKHRVNFDKSCFVFKYNTEHSAQVAQELTVERQPYQTPYIVSAYPDARKSKPLSYKYMTVIDDYTTVAAD